jgi:hypothetical protein
LETEEGKVFLLIFRHRHHDSCRWNKQAGQLGECDQRERGEGKGSLPSLPSTRRLPCFESPTSYRRGRTEVSEHVRPVYDDRDRYEDLPLPRSSSKRTLISAWLRRETGRARLAENSRQRWRVASRSTLRQPAESNERGKSANSVATSSERTTRLDERRHDLKGTWAARLERLRTSADPRLAFKPKGRYHGVETKRTSKLPFRRPTSTSGTSQTRRYLLSAVGKTLLRSDGGTDEREMGKSFTLLDPMRNGRIPVAATWSQISRGLALCLKKGGRAHVGFP